MEDEFVGYLSEIYVMHVKLSLLEEFTMLQASGEESEVVIRSAVAEVKLIEAELWNHLSSLRWGA